VVPGAFPNCWRRIFGVRVIGIDPSLKMLDQAGRKPSIGNVIYCQGMAEAVPFRDGCADLVFMSMVYHHFCGPIRRCEGMPSHVASWRLW
jgi:ubiquinone/menaquinone biosynthesis C-methylase UbiE